MTHRSRELTPPQQVTMGIIGIVQAAFAFLAAWDLWHRPESQVNGRKLAWVPVLLINWIGPASYFLFGIRRK